jgi:hypothetical protein
MNFVKNGFRIVALLVGAIVLACRGSRDKKPLEALLFPIWSKWRTCRRIILIGWRMPSPHLIRGKCQLRIYSEL